MRISDIIFETEQDVDEAKATRKYCLRPKKDMSASGLSSCKAQGYVPRETGKSQKVGNERVKLDGKKMKSTKYGGPVSPTRTG